MKFHHILNSQISENQLSLSFDICQQSSPGIAPMSLSPTNSQTQHILLPFRCSQREKRLPSCLKQYFCSLVNSKNYEHSATTSCTPHRIENVDTYDSLSLNHKTFICSNIEPKCIISLSSI